MNTARTRVIGIGQPNAGDDCVGIAVARALRQQKLPAGVDVHEITDPARLVDLLEGVQCAIVIDALLSDDSPGKIHHLAPEDLAACTSTPLSSHGTSVADAIGLLRVVTPETAGCIIHIIGVSIAPPQPGSQSLTPPVVAALPHAISLIVKLLNRNKP